MNFKDVKIPRQMRALMRDKRGYPVPYTVLRDSDGVPHFAVNDSARVSRCIKEKRCAICGTRIERELWLIGGPLSAFHPHGAFRDPALHYECAKYALQVCPYLASRRYTGRVDTNGMDFDKVPNGMAFLDSTMIPEHPELFIAVCTAAIADETPQGTFATIRPHRPFIRVEYWQDGQQLTFATGMELVAAALAAFQPPRPPRPPVHT